MSRFLSKADKVIQRTDEWDFYFCQVDHQPASIFVDLGRMNAIPSTGFENAAYLRLYMRHPRENGLSSDLEYAFLKKLEDAIEAALSLAIGVIYVGRNTSAGTRDFYFYTKDTNAFEKAATRVMEAQAPEYRYEIGSWLDANWDVYKNFLYPNPIAYRSILNRRVLDQLEEHGDNSEVVHKIDHRVYFDSLLRRRLFSAKIAAMGYQLCDELSEDEDTKALDFYRMDSLQDIDRITEELESLAAEHEGRYDGWGTEVIPHT